MARGESGPWNRSLRPSGRSLLALASAVLAATVGYGALYEARRVVLEEVRLPGSGPSLRIAQVSDVDFAGIGARERQVEALLGAGPPPDLLVVTGDLLEFRGGRGSRWLDDAVAFLDRLPSGRGVYWVVGESERHHLAELRRGLQGSRATLLFNEEVRFAVQGREVSLFGLGSANARFQPASLAGSPAVRARATGLYSPLVDATPGADRWENYEVSGLLQFGEAEDYIGVLAYVPAEDTTRGYALVRHRDRPGFHLRAQGSARALQGEPWGGPDLPAGLPVRYRLQVESAPERNVLRARVWRSDRSEPAAWHLMAEDTDPARPSGGAAGVCVKGGGDERWFGPWQVRSLENGATLGGRSLEGFDPLDGTWRFRSVLRDWAPPGAGEDRPFRLLLAHNPDVVLDLEEQGAGPVDLILCGHTQGGQIRLPGFGALYTGTELGRTYDAGLFRVGERLVYINRGIGTSFVPVRLFCAPEVTALSVPLDIAEGGA